MGTLDDLERLDEPENYEPQESISPGSNQHGEVAIVKAYLPEEPNHIREGLDLLGRMNITAAALFPGTHGLARSQYSNLIRREQLQGPCGCCRL